MAARLLLALALLSPAATFVAPGRFLRSTHGVSQEARARAPCDVLMGTCIGIDLGTTYSCVGVWQNGRVEICTNDQGNRVTPSYVSYTKEGRLVGEAAKNAAAKNPEGTLYDVKRLIGRDFNDKSVQEDIKAFPFDVVSVDGKPKIKADGKELSPEEVSASIIAKMKATAEAFLGKEVDSAVITVPAFFNDAQRQATKDAGKIAGLEVERVINEPTAAAIAYGLDKANDDASQKVLVFDFGGGTHDVTLLEIDGGVFEVIATNGDTHLGGEDFDNRLVNYCVEQFEAKHPGTDVKKDKRAIERLRRQCEQAKRALTAQTQTTIDIEALHQGEDFELPLSRAKFEELNFDLFMRTLEPVATVMRDSGLTKADIDEVVLVGGSTRIPKVQTLLQNYFDGKELNRGINADEAVAYGAAVQAGILSGDAEGTADLVLLDVTPLSLGVETAGGVMTKLIKRGTTIPVKKSQVFSTFADSQTTVQIEVYEGERSMVKDAHRVGSFQLQGIPPAPRGVPQIEVSFEVDANSILKVTAADKATNKVESITIASEKGRLSDEDIERMVKESEQFADDDKKAKDLVEARNGLESYLYNLKNSVLDGLKDKLSDEDKKTVETAVEDALVWLADQQDGTKEDFDGKQKEVETLVNPIITAAYQAAGGGPEGGAAPGGGDGGMGSDGAVDVDAVEDEFTPKDPRADE